MAKVGVEGEKSNLCFLSTGRRMNGKRRYQIYIIQSLGHYARWDKSDRERQILSDITFMWNLKKTGKNGMEWWLPGSGGWQIRGGIV